MSGPAGRQPHRGALPGPADGIGAGNHLLGQETTYWGMLTPIGAG